MNIKELKRGAILSYVIIVVNTLYGILFIPFLISTLGLSQYGVYKTIGSFAAAVTFLDFGIGTTTLRYIAKFRAENDKRQECNFFAMAMIEATVLNAIMATACGVMYCYIDALYASSFTPEELAKAKELFLLFTAILMLGTFEKVVFNVLSGCECFTVANGLALIRILLKAALAVAILSFIADAAFLLWIDVALLALLIVVQLVYLQVKQKTRIKLYSWDGKLFKESFGYAVLMFIQSVVVQFNGNLDNIVIGSIVGAAAVAVYSIGLQLYNMYEQFAVSFSNLMLPTVSKQVASGASNRELEDVVIKVGRLEFMALGAALCGFAFLGKEFIYLWLGEGYETAWLVGMILMVPTTIPLIQNVCLSILRAQNRMVFRTVAVCAMAGVNLVITIYGVKHFGALAACVGTAIGLVGANIIAMNVYYWKVLKINVFRIFKNVLSRTWLCCLIASAVLWGACQMIETASWPTFCAKAAIFVVVYGALQIGFGMNESEKKVLLNFKRRDVA